MISLNYTNQQQLIDLYMLHPSMFNKRTFETVACEMQPTEVFDSTFTGILTEYILGEPIHFLVGTARHLDSTLLINMLNNFNLTTVEYELGVYIDIINILSFKNIKLNTNQFTVLTHAQYWRPIEYNNVYSTTNYTPTNISVYDELGELINMHFLIIIRRDMDKHTEFKQTIDVSLVEHNNLVMNEVYNMLQNAKYVGVLKHKTNMGRVFFPPDITVDKNGKLDYVPTEPMYYPSNHVSGDKAILKELKKHLPIYSEIDKHGTTLEFIDLDGSMRKIAKKMYEDLNNA